MGKDEFLQNDGTENGSSQDWLQVWPPGAPLWPAASDANDASASPRRTWTLRTLKLGKDGDASNEVQGGFEGGKDGEVVNEAYELRIEDEALELLASSQVWKPRKL